MLEPRVRVRRIVPIILLFVGSGLVLAAVAMHAQVRGYMARCATSPSGQAMPIGDIPGWHQVFADDFNGTTLNTSNWGPYSGQPGGDTAGWWSPSHVVVGNC